MKRKSIQTDIRKLLKNKKAAAQDKKAFVASFDWEAMTAQDEAVWNRIFAHLDH